MMDNKCTSCDGSGKIKADDEIVKCPKCDGYGFRRVTALANGSIDIFAGGCFVRKPHYFND